MWGPCDNIFYLKIFQDSIYTAKLIRVGGSLTETVDGRCRCLKNVLNAGYVSSRQTQGPSRMASTCGPSTKALISEYNWGSSSNGQDPSVWCYLFKFSAIITPSGGVLSMIFSVMSSYFCWVKKVVPDLLNLPSVYLIHLYRVPYSSLCWILCIWMASGPLPAYSRMSGILVR